MVDCTLPNDIPEELIRLLPIQQEVLGKYMTEGKLIHYALSLENSKLWAIVNANSLGLSKSHSNTASISVISFV